MADVNNELWEEHADWWIEGFTDGADPEYEEQILPIKTSPERRELKSVRLEAVLRMILG